MHNVYFYFKYILMQILLYFYSSSTSEYDPVFNLDKILCLIVAFPVKTEILGYLHHIVTWAVAYSGNIEVISQNHYHLIFQNESLNAVLCPLLCCQG